VRGRMVKSAVGFAEVKGALPPGWALVAYVNYDRIFPYGPKERGSGSRRKPSTSYLAFTLGPSEQEPRVIPIGSAEEVEPLIEAWKREVATAPTGLRTAGSGAEERYRDIAQRLRKILWDPLPKGLKEAKKVFVVPDGAVNSVSLATLPAGRAGYLVGSGPLIHYLSSERDLIRMDAPAVASKGVLALGAPDFDALPARGAPGGSQPAAESGAKGSPEKGYRGLRATCGTFQSLHFDPLPASQQEVQELESIWSARSGKKEPPGEMVEKLMGAAATEAAFKKKAPGHRVLHLATHGFFVQAQCESDLANARIKAREAPTPARAELPILGDSPLLLSGLALAGANRRNEISPLSGEEDGILTAEEVASLDLSGTQWAVLSACETGVGVVQVGEGVLGTRRAFEVAGVDTLIMSLWRVEDDTSREWMRSLYEARRGGMDTATTIRTASMEMIRSRSAAGKSTHPFFWGAFVAAGDWK
ncbi:MAG: CHAT domain-containing protein, partial [Acidobacteria bacterium]|nr:CHAT domain-containing protein [Acidobacteriota bacterium]